MAQKSNPAERYKAASFGLAWSAAIAAVLFVFVYFWLLEDAPRGWFNDLLIAVLPGAVVVSVTYVVGYYFLIRKGMSRDQRLVESFLETLGERSAVAPEVVAFAGHPRDIPWSRLLDGAEAATIIARWFDTWSNENSGSLARFFERGGTLETVMLDPENETALAMASAQHRGFDPEREDVDAQRKVLTGLRRLVRAAERASREDALKVRLIANPGVVLTQTLMRFEGPAGTRIATYSLDNFRDTGHRSPALVLDPTASIQLQEFWDNERRGFEKNSRKLTLYELTELAK